MAGTFSVLIFQGCLWGMEPRRWIHSGRGDYDPSVDLAMLPHLLRSSYIEKYHQRFCCVRAAWGKSKWVSPAARTPFSFETFGCWVPSSSAASHTPSDCIFVNPIYRQWNISWTPSSVVGLVLLSVIFKFIPKNEETTCKLRKMLTHQLGRNGKSC